MVVKETLFNMLLLRIVPILLAMPILLPLAQFTTYPGGTTFNVGNTTWHGLRVLDPVMGKTHGDVVLGVNPCTNVFICAWSTNSSIWVDTNGGSGTFRDNESVLLYSAPDYTPISPERRTGCYQGTGTSLCTRQIALDVDVTTGTTILAALIMKNLDGENNTVRVEPGAVVLVSLFNEMDDRWLTDFDRPVMEMNSPINAVFGDLVLSSDTRGGWFLGWTINGVFEYRVSADDGASWTLPSVYGQTGVERVSLVAVGPGDWLLLLRRTTDGVFPRGVSPSVCIVDRFNGSWSGSTDIPEAQPSGGNAPIEIFRGRTALEERYGEGQVSVFVQIDREIHRSEDLGVSWGSYLQLGSPGILRSQLGENWLLIEGNTNVRVGGGFGDTVSSAYAEISANSGYLFSLARDSIGEIFAIYNKELPDGGSRIMLMDGNPAPGLSDDISSYWNTTSAAISDFCIQTPRVNSTVPSGPGVSGEEVADITVVCSSLGDVCILDEHFEQVIVGSKDNDDLITIDSNLHIENTRLVVKNSNLIVEGNLTIDTNVEFHLEDIDHTIRVNGCFHPDGTLYISENTTSSLNTGDRVDIISYECRSGTEFSSSNIETRKDLCSNLEYRETSLQLIMTECNQEEEYNTILIITVSAIALVSLILAALAVKVFWRRIFPYRVRVLAERAAS